MRLFTFMAASILFSAGTFACTIEHTTSAPAAEDGGAPKSGDAKKPTPFSGTKTDGGTTAEPPPSSSPKTCRDAALCLGECDDEPCQDACLAALPEGELLELHAVAVCIQESGCTDEDCIQQACGAEIATCAQ